MTGDFKRIQIFQLAEEIESTDKRNVSFLTMKVDKSHRAILVKTS